MTFHPMRPLLTTFAFTALWLAASSAGAQQAPPAGAPKPAAAQAGQPAAQQGGQQGGQQNGQAGAQTGARRRAGVIELNEITITGRVQKPVAAVDISRIAPKLSLTELRQPFLDQIEQALYRDPF